MSAHGYSRVTEPLTGRGGRDRPGLLGPRRTRQGWVLRSACPRLARLVYVMLGSRAAGQRGHLPGQLEGIGLWREALGGETGEITVTTAIAEQVPTVHQAGGCYYAHFRAEPP